MFRLHAPCPLLVAHRLCLRLMAIGLTHDFARLACSCAVVVSTLLAGCVSLPDAVARPESELAAAAVVLHAEPDSSLLLRLRMTLLSMFIAEELL
jgi:hypothetical protein